jgi:hypothetical protein
MSEVVGRSLRDGLALAEPEVSASAGLFRLGRYHKPKTLTLWVSEEEYRAVRSITRATGETHQNFLKRLVNHAWREIASGTDARRAETPKSGSVHDGPVPPQAADAQTPSGDSQ